MRYPPVGGAALTRGENVSFDTFRSDGRLRRGTERIHANTKISEAEGQARRSCVRRIGRRAVLLGGVRNPESRIAYGRAIAEWVANDGTLPVSLGEITIVEVAARFMAHAASYYRKPDRDTDERANALPVCLAAAVRLVRPNEGCGLRPARVEGPADMVSGSWRGVACTRTSRRAVYGMCSSGRRPKRSSRPTCGTRFQRWSG